MSNLPPGVTNADIDRNVDIHDVLPDTMAASLEIVENSLYESIKARDIYRQLSHRSTDLADFYDTEVIPHLKKAVVAYYDFAGLDAPF